MTPEQILAYVQAGQMLVSAGAATVAMVRQMFAAHPTMTEAERLQILAAIQADAEAREALARADAGGSPLEP